MISPGSMISPAFFDSCAFDGGDFSEQEASNKIRDLFDKHRGIINILHSVQKEINYENTPPWVRKLAATYIGTLKVPLTLEEKSVLGDIETIIVGNGIRENRLADCRHVFEAQKHGRYFVTTDNGILKHSRAIKRRLSTLFIVKPTQFLEIVRDDVET